MFVIVICLVLLMCTLTIWNSVLCVLMVESMSVVVNVILSLMCVMSQPPALCNLSACTVVKLCTLSVCFRGELGYLNCDDICMCVVNKQFELLEFVFDYVNVDMQYDEMSLTSTAGYVSLWCICSHLWSVCEVVMVPYVDAVFSVMRVLLLVLHVCMLRECDGARLTAMLV